VKFKKGDRVRFTRIPGVSISHVGEGSVLEAIEDLRMYDVSLDRPVPNGIASGEVWSFGDEDLELVGSEAP
jgi:hypothetical protein